MPNFEVHLKLDKPLVRGFDVIREIETVNADNAAQAQAHAIAVAQKRHPEHAVQNTSTRVVGGSPYPKGWGK